MTERGIDQLRPDNHALYIRVQTMLNMRCKYEDICDNLGLVGPNRVNELCEWFIAYKTPKALPMVRTQQVFEIPSRSYVHSANAARFIAWRRQHQGVLKTLEAAGL